MVALELPDAPRSSADPLPGGDGVTEAQHRILIRCDRRVGRRLTEALKATQGVRSARKAPAHVRIRVDPVDLA